MRKSPAPLRLLVALLATLALACASLFGFAPVTPRGVQCPTAPVQTVVVRSCCDHRVTRAPAPGDKAFVQCRCAEKKAAAHEATAPAKVTLFLVAGETSPAPAPSALAWDVPAFRAAFRSVGFPPSVRPPTLS